MQGTWVQSLVGERRSHMLLRAAKERERKKKKDAQENECMWASGESILKTSSSSSCCCSVVQSFSTLCDPHGLQHPRLPCPSLSPGVCSNSCPLSSWCHPTISSSVTPLLLLLSIFPSIRVFPSGWALHIRGQRNGASASASDLPVKVQGWFPLGLIGFILLSRGLPCKDLSLNIYRFK